MTIDWNAFTPWQALAGGMLIGLSAVMMVLLNGLIAGISGIVGGLLRPKRLDKAWRVAFVVGLFAAALLYGQLIGSPRIVSTSTPLVLVIAGLLVGFGTRLGSGCTSGHGVCGLARRSPRSIVATLSFMGFGFAVVFVLRHVGV